MGVSRAGLGPAAILASRYVTLTTPLLCVIYIAWLVYGRAPARVGIHAALLVLLCVTLPGNRQFSKNYGWSVRVAEQRVERSLKDHVPTAVLLKQACPAIYPDPRMALESFRMLKLAGIGAFAEFEEDRVTSATEAAGPLRR